MKNLSQPVRLLIWAGFGLIIGAVVSLILTVALTPVWGMSATNLCFYLGLIVLIIGLFASMKGNANISLSSDRKGSSEFFEVNIAAEEENSTQAMSKHYHDNHVINVNAFSACLILAGIVMVVISHLTISGKL